LIVFSAFLVCVAPPSSGAGDPKARLQQRSPWLYGLYEAYPQFHGQMALYAAQQGFLEPENVLVTTLHELIHIDSAAHQGYSVAGTYLAPYVSHASWPFLNNADVAAYLSPSEKSALEPIYSSYIRQIPQNRLGNVLDEVNAYSQTVPFLCQETPGQAVAHLHNLVGHLTLVEFYLRTLRERFPAQHEKLTKNRVSRGALETLVANAYKTLNLCFQLGLREADPRKVPKSATEAFSEQPK